MPAGFAGHLSDDADGRALLQALEADGVDVGLVSIGYEKTTRAVATVDGSGVARYEFTINGTAAPELTRAMLPERFDADVDAICFGSLGLVLEPMASTLMDLVAREHGRRVVVLDPNVRPGLRPDGEYRARLSQAVSFSTVVKASDADLSWMYPDLDAPAAAERLIREGVRLVVVTLGADGAYAAHASHRVRVPAAPANVVDTIGAGDAFGAALVAWLHEHAALAMDIRFSAVQLREALEFACLAAAITCSRPGADPPRRRELTLPR